MLLSVVALFFVKDAIIFIPLYLLCGLSDILDGYIARKTNTKSILGAKLDSVADLMMFGMIVYLIVILGREKNLSRLFLLIVIIALIRIAGLIFAALKYHSLVLLHTWGNKLTGILIYFSPIILMLYSKNVILYLIIAIATLSAVEEVIIHIVAKQPDLNRRSLFWK
jgi:CDP-diacylglycerol--glycerol-3-phosphate 3-phosphatidyltransferase